MLIAPRDEHRKDTVTSSDGFLDHFAVVRRAGNDCDAPFERIEFAHTALPANSNYRIAPIQSVLNHVGTEFSRCPYNADFHSFLLYHTNLILLRCFGWIAAQQNDSQPDEPDDLAQAKNSDHHLGQPWDEGDDAHRADGQAEDIQSLGKPARPQ